MGDVKPWPKAAGKAVDLPRMIFRPCDASLTLAIIDLETQLGTIEAYNRLIFVAQGLKQKIDKGEAKPQNPIYACKPNG